MTLVKKVASFTINNLKVNPVEKQIDMWLRAFDISPKSSIIVGLMKSVITTEALYSEFVDRLETGDLKGIIKLLLMMKQEIECHEEWKFLADYYYDPITALEEYLNESISDAQYAKWADECDDPELVVILKGINNKVTLQEVLEEYRALNN